MSRVALRSWGAVVLCGGLLGACVDDSGPPHLTWEPMQELNAELPEGLAVFAGVDTAAPLRAWYVTVQPGPHLALRMIASDDSDGVETATEFAARTAARVVLNGGYFRMGEAPMRHVGLLMIDGRIVEPAVDSVLRDGERFFLARGALGIMQDGRPDIAWVSSRDGVLYEWVSPPPNLPGAPVQELHLEGLEQWFARDAMAAGPVLVMNGERRVSTDAEVFFGTAVVDPNPRTAAGVTAEGVLILVVVDGRQRDSRGVDLEELATVMLELGAVEAINLDGGGSTTLVVNGDLVNRPVGSEFEREIMSAVLVLDE